MRATDELRRLLDERGVEWTENDGEHVKETCWPYMGELMAEFSEYDNGTTRFACDTWCFTPEQAVEATLGRGECHDCLGDIEQFECSECHRRSESKFPNYCHYCGRKVKTMSATEELRRLLDERGIRWTSADSLGHERRCHLVYRYGDWYCTSCGEMVGTCDSASELYVGGNAVEHWRYCPYCGSMVIASVVER